MPMAAPEQVDAVDAAAFTVGSHYAYAWIDEAAGRLRARMFAPEMGTAEDEATGAAAVAITARIGRDLSIEQGAGSRIATRLAGDGVIDVGGRTVHDRTIAF
jgi:predicted PhzF superfamily epimerase YddE/YHI9